MTDKYRYSVPWSSSSLPFGENAILTLFNENISPLLQMVTQQGYSANGEYAVIFQEKLVQWYVNIDSGILSYIPKFQYSINNTSYYYVALG